MRFEKQLAYLEKLHAEFLSDSEPEAEPGDDDDSLEGDYEEVQDHDTDMEEDIEERILKSRRQQRRLTYFRGGEPQLRFVQHPLIELEVDIPKEDKEEELTPENVDYEDDVEYLRSLDPKEWKSQDHYKVLGIPNIKYKATDDIIKTAYRKKVLKQHPDKHKALGEEIKTDDDYVTCITMVYETIGNISRRRAYDSFDPQFDNDLPCTSDIKKDFYKAVTYYFDLNSRWSEKTRVPKLRTENSTKEEVEHFYSFWYDFKSWREYSYEDEEEKDKCQDRLESTP
ncbi:dnaJ homolog subfamily C member 2-like [Diabrotica virgifera virgifera]|uniref:J domain-containing protein n=1 Tax=Diabrotica virgifera virgifera TaxID=50390 RepID=A0ABM5JZP7_DIAVI|nr:dnaJ homolog subfamily C member 2-like [Diabrotica virgifera virgifera]